MFGNRQRKQRRFRPKKLLKKTVKAVGKRRDKRRLKKELKQLQKQQQMQKKGQEPGAYANDDDDDDDEDDDDDDDDDDWHDEEEGGGGDNRNRKGAAAAERYQPPRRTWWSKIKLPLWYLGAVAVVVPIYILVETSQPESPQAKAYSWMRGLPTFDTPELTMWHKQQYFALATLVYSLDFEQWDAQQQGLWLNYTVPECYWWDNQDSISMCNSNNRVTWIQKQNNQHIINGTLPYELQLLPDLSVLQFSNMTNFYHTLKYLLPFPVEEPQQHSKSALPNLQGLFISENPLLNGTIPNLTLLTLDLTHLDLHANILSGDIPTSLGNLTLLQYLDLSNNWLNGTIPSELGLLTQLTHLNLSYNTLQGTVPRDLESLTKLKVLDVSHNDLVGTLFTDMGDLTLLEQFLVNSNQFQGSIPSEVGLLMHLQFLDLHENYFTGTLPQEFCDEDSTLTRETNLPLDIVLQCQWDHVCPKTENCTAMCSCHEASHNPS